MFSLLRNRFGIPGVISVIALVFAMLGGAYAANDSGGGKATASAKAKQGPRGKTGKTGPAGPAGPAGPTGPAGSNGAKGDTGAKGDKGDAGNAGSPGTNGKSVKVTAASALQCNELGGAIVEVQGEPATAQEVCSGEKGEPGEKGDPWTAGGVLPPGALETGTWSFNGTTADNPAVYTPISFPIKLAGRIERPQIHFQTDADFESFCGGGAPFEGVYLNPNAAPGELCIYANPPIVSTEPLVNADFVSITGITPTGEAEGVTRVGGLLHFTMTDTENAGYGFGSFAVRGCSAAAGPNECP